jgi:pseudouridine-5'-phosphate glycosidase
MEDIKEGLPAGAVLVETALLGQGLPSIAGAQMAGIWPAAREVVPVWLQEGRVVLGGIEQFLPLRAQEEWPRIDGDRLDEAITGGRSGFLTASAVMRVANAAGGNLVVTAGMGGVRNGRVSQDLILLSRLKVLLVASAPKDSQNLWDTIAYLRRMGVRTVGKESRCVDGFLFTGDPVCLDAVYGGESPANLSAGQWCLLLNPLPAELRLRDHEILKEALAAGDRARQKQEEFHPAVNRALDRLTCGEASRLQLQALAANLELALALQRKTP